MTLDVLDTAAAAALLRCAESTIEEHARSGNLPGLKFGEGGWVFPATAFFDRINELATDEAAKRRAITARRKGTPPKL